LYCMSPWAPAGMGKEGGALPRWKCCKVFCSSAVAVKCSLNQLFMYYFHNVSPAPHFLLGREDLEGRSGLFSSFGRVSRATTKQRSSTFLRKKCTPEKILATPMNFPTPGTNLAGARVCLYSSVMLCCNIRDSSNVLSVMCHIWLYDQIRSFKIGRKEQCYTHSYTADVVGYWLSYDYLCCLFYCCVFSVSISTVQT